AGKVSHGNAAVWLASTVGGVIGAFGPAFVVLAAWASRVLWRRSGAGTGHRDSLDQTWLMYAAWPSLAFFVLLSLWKPVVASWPLPSLVPLVPLVALALGVSAALGTRWFVFGRPWPVIRNALHLGPPDLEPEIPPRFAQALGASFLAVATLLLAFGWSLGWLFVAAVAALQTVLAVTGFCLGCRLYGLTWFVPSVFDRLVGVERPTALPRRRIERVG
ncbi:MAG: DUF4395 family protein, partial [Chloroflexota bacterium]